LLSHLFDLTFTRSVRGAAEFKGSQAGALKIQDLTILETGGFVMRRQRRANEIGVLRIVREFFSRRSIDFVPNVDRDRARRETSSEGVALDPPC
jgi:hypothetical protein